MGASYQVRGVVGVCIALTVVVARLWMVWGIEPVERIRWSGPAQSWVAAILWDLR